MPFVCSTHSSTSKASRVHSGAQEIPLIMQIHQRRKVSVSSPRIPPHFHSKLVRCRSLLRRSGPQVCIRAQYVSLCRVASSHGAETDFRWRGLNAHGDANSTLQRQSTFWRKRIPNSDAATHPPLRPRRRESVQLTRAHRGTLVCLVGGWNSSAANSDERRSGYLRFESESELFWSINRLSIKILRAPGVQFASDEREIGCEDCK